MSDPHQQHGQSSPPTWRATDTTPLPLQALGGPPAVPPTIHTGPSGPPGPLGPTGPVGQQRPYGPVPGQQQQQVPAMSKGLKYLLQALVLVLVALISGVIWWALHRPADTSAANQQPTVPVGKYEFTAFRPAVQDSNCAEHSYSKVEEFFRKTPCEQLTRTLYLTQLGDGRRAAVSVSVVQMAKAADATRLRALVKADGTGNVIDLVSDGEQVPGGPRTLKGGGFACEQHGGTVVLAESGFFDNDLKSKVLAGISLDALRLAGS